MVPAIPATKVRRELFQEDMTLDSAFFDFDFREAYRIETHPTSLFNP
jgi:hypothetical protein